MDTASAAPSTGSVPLPISSISTRLRSSARLSIFTTFTMCEEKVDRLCSMLCSSPISTYIPPKTPISEPSPAGIISPHMVMRVSSPTVFMETVLPPVFGPVMIRHWFAPPISTDIGTTEFWSISGCRAWCRSTLGSDTIFAATPRIFAPRFALAKYNSSISATRKLFAILSALPATCSESSRVIRSISACSRDLSTRISLFASTTLIGSMKNVCPVAEVSCTRPATSFLYSLRTGTTYRPSRTVTMASCRNFCVLRLFMSLSSCSRIFIPCRTIRFLIEASSGLAASDISSSEIILSEMRCSSCFIGYSSRKYSDREFSMPSHWLNQSQSIAVSRRISATSSSSRKDSAEPLLHRRSDMEMSFILRNLGVPNFADRLNASLVF